MKNILYNLTNPQKSILLVEQYCPNSNINNIGGNVFIDQIVDFGLLERSLNIYIQKNEQIRSRLVLVNGEYKQYIQEYAPFSLEVISLQDTIELDNLSSKLINCPFTLLDSNLFKFTLFRFNNGFGGFNVNFHHFVSDAWTMGLFVSEVIDIYSKLLSGDTIDFSPNPSYINYISDEKQYEESSKFTNDRDYWLSKFTEEPVVSKIMNYSNTKSSILANRKSYFLDSLLYDRISTFCKSKNCSIFTFLMAIYSIYLYGLNPNSNVTIGTPVLNRTNFKEKHTAGMFISVVPFCFSIDPSVPFSSFVSAVAVNQLGIFRHQKFPYELLLKDIKQQYSDVQYLYDLALSYQNARDNNGNFTIPFHTTWLFNGTVLNSMDIHFYDMDNSGTLNIFYDYQIDKFKEDDISSIHNRILYIIDQVLLNSNILIKNISLITKEESLLLSTFNNSAISHPYHLGVHNLIDRNSQTSPNHVAVFDDTESICYSELERQSIHIAKNLISLGVKKGDCVAVLFEKKDISLITSILGILKSGAFFMPIYAEYPDERIAYMLKNSQCTFLITEDLYANKDYPVKKLFLHSFSEIKEEICFPSVSDDDNAYIIYTSGSTGEPKGTLQSHNNLINFVYSFNHFFDNSITQEDNFLSVTNICFDVSIAEIFTPLVFGASLYLYKDLNYSNSTELCSYMIENKITFSYFPPAMLSDIADELEKVDIVPLSKLLVGVEPIKASILHRYLLLNPNMKIVNGYGPSETTICCTMYPFDKNLDPDSITPIGHAIGNSNTYIVNSSLQLLPIGEIGELYIQGECVGNGYFNNTKMTNERFSLDKRSYATGDLAKWLPNGNILFVGRNDSQIKYRGYRIDLGEIELSIKKLPNVKNCIVLVDTSHSKSERLTSFILTDVPMGEEFVRSTLSKTLPHYMLPSQFIFLKEFRLTPNGKVDKKELLKLVTKFNTSYLAPTSEMEIKMCNIWSKILNHKKIGINDNFFDLGGDSLDAMKISAIANDVGIHVSAQDFYNYPTIHLLCNKSSVHLSQNSTCYLRKIPIQKNYPSNFTGDILLVGATGFLGIHLLVDILNNTPFTVYCLVRGTSTYNSIARLKDRLHFYFGEQGENYLTERIIVLNGDFSKENFGLSKQSYGNILNTIGTIINAAALVKHIGDYDYFYKMNILSVKNLITFCMQSPNNPHLAHISTMSVSGDSTNALTSTTFSEDDLFIGQEIEDNVYIKTKFEAEALLAEHIQNGLNATIFRLGNITWRNTDGQFQVNEDDNLFYNIIKFIIATKSVPQNLLDYTFNISPVDYCSTLILRILMENNKFNVYHIYNFNELKLGEIVAILNQIGFSIEIIENASYEDLKKQSTELTDLFAHVSSCFSTNKKDTTVTTISNPYTNTVIEQLGFLWPKVDLNYFYKKFGGKNNEKKF